MAWDDGGQALAVLVEQAQAPKSKSDDELRTMIELMTEDERRRLYAMLVAFGDCEKHGGEWFESYIGQSAMWPELLAITTPPGEMP